MKTPSVRNVLGQPSWRLANSAIEAFLTVQGGHLGPITFDRQGSKIQPMSVAPWYREKKVPGMPPIIDVLRGDFFCMPFGGNDTPYRGEQHPVHGETANAKWTCQSIQKSDGQTTLHARLKTKIRRGQVDKRITLVDAHPVVYQTHTISKMAGRMNMGHHAMVQFPDRPGSGLVATSRFVQGQVFLQREENPITDGYSSLKPAAEFDSLDSVPTLIGDTTDLSRYPARRGYEDIVMLTADPSLTFAWSAVTFPKERYAWFALKDPALLPQTVFWISNGGRHHAPWNSRHTNVMGIEEVCAYFHPGLAQSAKANPQNKAGHPTTIQLNAKKPTTLPYAFGVTRVPARFGHIQRIEQESPEGIVLIDTQGKSVRVPFDLNRIQNPSV